MKVNIVARPDHSLGLYEQLVDLKLDEDSIDLYTFYAWRKGSLLNRLFPKRKVAPHTATTLDRYTVVSRLSNKVLNKIGGNPRRNEERLFRRLAPLDDISNCDVLHYWPFYCAEEVRKIKLYSGVSSVADYYEASPSFVNSIFREEFDRFGVPAGHNQNLLIDQNYCFMFEENFIVPSEFVKNSYKDEFPDKNYHVCSYGPAGHSLCENYEAIVERKSRESVKRIVFVGQVCLEKGVQYLVEAVRGSGFCLDIIGPVRKGQERVFRSILSGQDNVRYLGGMKNSEVMKKLEDYHVFCMPSLSDSYSLAAVEALSHGIPVLVTEHCGISDDVEKFGLGYVAKVKSYESLRVNLERFQSDFDYNKYVAGLSGFFSFENQLMYPKSVYNVYRLLSEG